MDDAPSLGGCSSDDRVRSLASGGDVLRICERLAKTTDRLSTMARTIGAEGLALHLAFTSDEARTLATEIKAAAVSGVERG